MVLANNLREDEGWYLSCDAACNVVGSTLIYSLDRTKLKALYVSEIFTSSSIDLFRKGSGDESASYAVHR